LSGDIGQNPAAWSSYYVPAITQGTSYYGRIGNQVWAKRLLIKAGINRTAAGSTVQRVRLMVIRNIDPVNAATPATELFSATNLFDPMRNPNYLKNYIILYDKVFILDSAKANYLPIEIKLPLGFPIKFSGNAGTVADVTLNNVEIVVWGDQAANKPALAGGTFRFIFNDQ